jgi:hypothetical protein
MTSYLRAIHLYQVSFHFSAYTAPFYYGLLIYGPPVAMYDLIIVSVYKRE